MGYGYGYGLGGYYGGYRSYGLGYGHGLYYGKREAEAEPEADAYYVYGGYGLGGLYGGYRSYGLGYGHGVYHYGKREAEPYYGVYSAHHAVAPVVSYAHHAVAAPVVSSYAQVSPSASLSTVGIA